MLTLKSVSIGMGLLMVIIYLPFVFNYKGWQKAMLELFKDSKVIRLFGIIMLLIAFLLLNTHHTFEKAWPILVSILGWLTLIKGTVWVWAPKFVERKAKFVFKKYELLMVFAGVAGLGIGVFLEYVGFYIF